MNAAAPDYALNALDEDERVLAFVPEPTEGMRSRMLRALAPMFALLAVPILILVLNDDPKDLGDALVGWAVIIGTPWLLVHWLRRCRTSYAITSKRAIRFVSGRRTEELSYADSHRPFLLSYADSPSVILRWLAGLFSLEPMVRLTRRVPMQMTFGLFLSGRDHTGMRIGGPGLNLPFEEILDKSTRAWEETQ